MGPDPGVAFNIFNNHRYFGETTSLRFPSPPRFHVWYGCCTHARFCPPGWPVVYAPSMAPSVRPSFVDNSIIPFWIIPGIFATGPPLAASLLLPNDQRSIDGGRRVSKFSHAHLTLRDVAQAHGRRCRGCLLSRVDQTTADESRGGALPILRT